MVFFLSEEIIVITIILLGKQKMHLVQLVSRCLSQFSGSRDFDYNFIAFVINVIVSIPLKYKVLLLAYYS